MSKIAREIFEINGRKSFMKAKANAFEIDKLMLSFVEFNEQNKAVKTVDFYMKITDALVFAMDVLSGKLPKLAAEKAKQKPEFPPYVYMRQGGISPSKAKRADGKALARVFKFGASSKPGYFLFQAESGPGKQDARGLIQMENISKPEKRINVMCSSDDLKALCLSIKADYAAYLCAAYMQGKFEDKYEHN